ncbi:Wzz/FepE/Etk N-terminal domain-containing protein [Candidatus Pelagibacter sp. FZCC0015]|uniref:Wzz/FepE/Etk N-terminal domain-containing protein n=1 Tax=Candidatus Pelagibacter sp. FZCC0015 TaxID=2268451 RepID=UPI0011A5FD10|nr:Wzz/FepE/Etk N-terminal domain-containing protein [Candidatus Pelagibacter sp. FZCC0015]
MSEINQTKTHYEVDLVDLLKALWLGKWKIIIITAISVLVVLVYSNSIPKKYKLTTVAYHGDRSSFIKYSVINDILKLNDLTATEGRDIPNKYVLNPSRIFHKARVEFNNYQAVTSVLENEISIMKSFDGTDEQKQDLLIKLARSFNFLTPTKQGEKYSVSFTWENIEEGKKIFDKAMAKVMENVKKSVIKDISNLANIIEKNNQRKIDSLNLKFELLEKAQKEKDMARIEYLKEQSTIAKEINLEQNMEGLSLGQSKQSLFLEPTQGSNSTKNKSLIDLIEVPFLEVPYFLLGYRAIDKEIELILNRTDRQRILNTTEYIKVMAKLIEVESDLSPELLRQSISIIENDNVKNWIKYDFSLGSTKSLNNTRLYIMVAIMFGLTFGSVFVIISHYFRKNNKSI